MLGKLKDHLVEKGIALKYTDSVLHHIAKESFSEKYGARNMRRYIEKNVEDEIANILIESFPRAVSAIGISVVEDKLKFDTL